MVRNQCPPGVFCISNMTIFMILVIIGVLLYVSYVQLQQHNALHKQKSQHSEMSHSFEQTQMIQPQHINFPSLHSATGPFYTNPNYIMSSQHGDTYLNPYSPPLRQNPFFPNLLRGDVRGGIPINIPTSHHNMEYKQVGILTRDDQRETILALFGRPLHSNRNKWQYYTMTDKNQAIKLPINKGGKSGSGAYGCDEIFSGDMIYVDGYNDAFKATIYENSEPRYIPYL